MRMKDEIENVISINHIYIYIKKDGRTNERTDGWTNSIVQQQQQFGVKYSNSKLSGEEIYNDK